MFNNRFAQVRMLKFILANISAWICADLFVHSNFRIALNKMSNDNLKTGFHSIHLNLLELFCERISLKFDMIFTLTNPNSSNSIQNLPRKKHIFFDRSLFSGSFSLWLMNFLSIAIPFQWTLGHKLGQVIIKSFYMQIAAVTWLDVIELTVK